MKAVRFVVVPCAAAIAVLVAASTGVTSTGDSRAYMQGPPTYCGMKSGPAYATDGLKNQYVVSVRNVKCSFATLWMRKLASQPARRDMTPLSGGPPGYQCLGSPMTGLSKRAVKGWCRKGKLQFYWLPPGGGTG